jgi:hypothetical protein
MPGFCVYLHVFLLSNGEIEAFALMFGVDVHVPNFYKRRSALKRMNKRLRASDRTVCLSFDPKVSKVSVVKRGWDNIKWRDAFDAGARSTYETHSNAFQKTLALTSPTDAAIKQTLAVYSKFVTTGRRTNKGKRVPKNLGTFATISKMFAESLRGTPLERIAYPNAADLAVAPLRGSRVLVDGHLVRPNQVLHLRTLR